MIADDQYLIGVLLDRSNVLSSDRYPYCVQAIRNLRYAAGTAASADLPNTRTREFPQHARAPQSGYPAEMAVSRMIRRGLVT